MTRENWTWARVIVFGLLISTLLPVSARASSGADVFLNRYYATKDDDPKEALAILEEAAKRFSNDVRVHSEIAFHSLRAGDRSRALRAMRTAAALTPDRADIWRQIGYIEIDLGKFNRALAAFLRARRIDPNDEQVAMQIGYLQQQLGQNRSAAESFRSVLNAADKNRAEQACGAYRNVRGVPDKLLPKPWFAETYMAPEYRTHYDVAVLPFEGRIGVSSGTTTVVDAYVSLRGTLDTRSGQTNFGPLTYYDNAAVLAGGLRLRPSTKLPFFLFVEAGTAYDLVDRNRDRWRSDVRGGAVAYKQWNMEPPCLGEWLFPFRFIADVYGDAVYYSRYDDNILLYGRVRPGFRLFETPVQAVDAYLLGALNADVQSVKDNGFEEFGAGLAMHVYEPFRWTARTEFVNVERREADGFLDFRLRLEYQARFRLAPIAGAAPAVNDLPRKFVARLFPGNPRNLIVFRRQVDAQSPDRCGEVNNVAPDRARD